MQSVWWTLVAMLLVGVDAVEDAAFWKKYGQDRLQEALLREPNVGRARNIIVFIGDGMGVSTVTAGRIYQGQRQGKRGEEHSLSFEKFPYVGLAKTYNVDKQVPDSAATATAILSGVKVNFQSVNMDATASAVCDPVHDKARRIHGLTTWSQLAGKHTGLVTTTTVTHATPSVMYSFANKRHWECDTEIPVEQRDCVKDIARQLVEESPGNRLNVVLGGGQRQMGVSYDADELSSCARGDGRNLVRDWLRAKPSGVYVNTTEALMSADLTNTDHLLGLFSPGHMPYIPERGPEHPSLVAMTTRAIQLLSKNPKGFFLLVEGGRIDVAHHYNLARIALQETAEFADAVSVAVEMTDPAETLIIVTADHSHAMTMNGYPTRGNDILGYANRTNTSHYETITYANGPGYLVHHENGIRKSLADMNRTDPRYQHMAGMHQVSETHGGEDVAVFATGPFAHLLAGAYEQNYIAHVAAHAGCIGEYTSHCTADGEMKPGGSPVWYFAATILLIVVVIAISFYISKRMSRKKGGEVRI